MSVNILNSQTSSDMFIQVPRLYQRFIATPIWCPHSGESIVRKSLPNGTSLHHSFCKSNNIYVNPFSSRRQFECEQEAAPWAWHSDLLKTFKWHVYTKHDYIISTKSLWHGSRDRTNIKIVFAGMKISIIKIRRSWNRALYIMEIPIPVRRHLYTAAAPGRHSLRHPSMAWYILHINHVSGYIDYILYWNTRVFLLNSKNVHSCVS